MSRAQNKVKSFSLKNLVIIGKMGNCFGSSSDSDVDPVSKMRNIYLEIVIFFSLSNCHIQSFTGRKTSSNGCSSREKSSTRRKSRHERSRRYNHYRFLFAYQYLGRHIILYILTYVDFGFLGAFSTNFARYFFSHRSAIAGTPISITCSVYS